MSALGACGMLVTAFALVRDLYAPDESARLYSFLNGAVGISPTFAPILGGYLAAYLGWQSVFIFLAVIALFAFLITAKFIRETVPREQRVTVDGKLLQRYIKIFTHRQLLTFSIISGLAEGVFFCFFSISPFIIIELHGVPTHEFGYYFALFGLVITLGGFASGKLIEKLGINGTLALGMALMFAGGVFMLLGHIYLPPSLAGFLIPMAIACMGAMFLVGGSAAKALEPFGATAGTASAAFGAIQFGLSSLAGSLLMLFPATSPFPYSVAILIMAAISMVMGLNFKKLPGVRAAAAADEVK